MVVTILAATLVLLLIYLKIRKDNKQIMAEIDDLRSVIVSLAAAIKRETADVSAVLAQMVGTIHPSDLKDLTAQIQGGVDSINAAAVQIEAALPAPPPAPAPAPAPAPPAPAGLPADDPGVITGDSPSKPAE